MNNLSLGENTLPNPHYPVLLSEIIQNLQPENGKKYLDCTFGAGGYTKAILDTANCFVKALDQDPTVYEYAEKLKLIRKQYAPPAQPAM
jgi:16S rRNA (cytosine1402-N4)-methyltransferase